ncbi:uncharacterized protein LOC117340863 [Pecten maximus]|uniref:uncharacterized protein LOC117340863 n=1 Tax=Pecten maximus TaxID=6579 RepID=UPI001458D632|nr:uncharacterized protein LOC117340863 [Pecten maximus]
MTISLPLRKRVKVKDMSLLLLNTPCPTIETVAQCIGVLVSSFPGVQYGPRHYRSLEKDKIRALQKSRGNYSAQLQLSKESKTDLQWWINNVDSAMALISHLPPSVILTSDASKKGWGGIRYDKDGTIMQSAGGRWSELEANQHINVLELKAAWFSCLALCRNEKNCHIRINIDNTTAIAYISHMGGKTPTCNALAGQIWDWCVDNKLWLSAAHIAGRNNSDADLESRLEHDNTEWKLDSNLFHKVTQQFGKPEMDLFASRLNNQLPKYVSWRPDPYALAQEDIDSSSSEGKTTAQDDTSSMQGFRSAIQKWRLSQETQSILLSSWRDGTYKQYNTYIQKWYQYSDQRSCDPMSPSVTDILEFLTNLFHGGIGYSALNTARSALSTFIYIDNLPCGNHPLVKRFLPGVFQLRPALPRNAVTWDPQQVLVFLEHLDCATIKNLTLKLTVLLALLTGQRAQSLHLLDLRNITIDAESVKIRFGDKLKHTRPGHHQQEIVLNSFSTPELCIVNVLTRYLAQTEQLRVGATQLLISYQKPYKPVTRATISRWIKTVLSQAGIDMTIFTPHSTRSASTSAALRTAVPLSTILKTAGWTNKCTFGTYYNKPVTDPVYKICL